jgi:Protein of unknown function (DUF3048) N-terminal domain/Protein of unknown function (DUF3048) C-terminal domain
MPNDKIKKQLSDEDLLNTIGPDDDAPDDLPKQKRAPLKKLKKWFHNLTKKQKVALIAISFIVIVAIVLGLFFVFKGDKKIALPAVKKTETKKVVKPTTEPGRLTGVSITPELNQRGVVGIMIENSPDARPQSGLKDAGVVFEAIAEGGITRFLTLYQEAQPDYIGPVRSVRPYYLDWLQGFDAPIAHAGGSADGLAKIRNENIPDLDQFANSGSYMRINTRYAPHNLYTTMAKLDALRAAKGFTKSTFEGFARKAETPVNTPTARSIDFNISSFLYSPHYDYDPATNTYKRSQGGKPHTDERSGLQIAPKVIIANVMSYGIASNGVNSNYNTIGSGKSYIFQDGTVTIGTWEKTGSKNQMVFKDASGKVIKLNPGQTWISAVGSASGVSYKP